MRYAICNETFDGWEHGRVCAAVAELGYQGLELAPFTLGPKITEVTATQRSQVRRQAEACGLQIVGLHWLLAKTAGLQLTAPTPKVRQKTADHLVELARLTRDLGGELMVLGSPAQRRIPPGTNRRYATDWAIDTLQRTVPGLEATGVKICLEPLGPVETDFLNTCAEAVAIIQRIGHPQIILHLDVKAMAADDAPIAELIRRHGSQAGHFHANDVNRRGPGYGDIDFVPIFQALKDSGYNGWVSVEVFDFLPDPLTIARESLRYMRECEAKVV